MTNMDETSTVTRMSDEAVQAKTGHSWREWFAILDAADAQRMNHKEIVAYLSEQHAVEPWWRQMVTVTYEQERGLRAKHEMPDGYQISCSKTVAVGVAGAYDAWQDEATRCHWLPEAITIRKATLGKSMRIGWVDGTSRIDVAFYPRGEGKCQVTVQHSRLADSDAAAGMKAYWTAALDRLKRLLEAED